MNTDLEAAVREVAHHRGELGGEKYKIPEPNGGTG